MATIDYAKYANMDRRQLFNALIIAEKRENEKSKEVQELKKLIVYLKKRVINTMQDSEKYEFVTYEEMGLDKVAEEVKKQIPLERQKQLEQEVQEEMNKDYGDEL